MGKKPKSGKGKEKAQNRKLDKSELPPPPAAVADEVRLIHTTTSRDGRISDDGRLSGERLLVCRIE